jgi:hypothetical protein
MSSYTLRLPESLKQAAKRIAAADDATMNQFFVDANSSNMHPRMPNKTRDLMPYRHPTHWATSII